MQNREITEVDYLVELQSKYNYFANIIKDFAKLLPDSIEEVNEVIMGIIDILEINLPALKSMAKEVCRYRAMKAGGRELKYYSTKPRRIPFPKDGTMVI